MFEILCNLNSTNLRSSHEFLQKDSYTGQSITKKELEELPLIGFLGTSKHDWTVKWHLPVHPSEFLKKKKSILPLLTAIELLFVSVSHIVCLGLLKEVIFLYFMSPQKLLKWTPVLLVQQLLVCFSVQSECFNCLSHNAALTLNNWYATIQISIVGNIRL